MGFVETRDSVTWAKGVHDDELLRELILWVPSGTCFELEFPEFGTGTFAKMKDGPNGPTNGIRPIQATKTLWRTIQATKFGTPVQVRLVDWEGSTMDLCDADSKLTPAQQHWMSQFGNSSPSGRQRRLKELWVLYASSSIKSPSEWKTCPFCAETIRARRQFADSVIVTYLSVNYLRRLVSNRRCRQRQKQSRPLNRNSPTKIFIYRRLYRENRGNQRMLPELRSLCQLGSSLLP